MNKIERDQYFQKQVPFIRVQIKNAIAFHRAKTSFGMIFNPNEMLIEKNNFVFFTPSSNHHFQLFLDQHIVWNEDYAVTCMCFVKGFYILDLSSNERETFLKIKKRGPKPASGGSHGHDSMCTEKPLSRATFLIS